MIATSHSRSSHLRIVRGAVLAVVTIIPGAACASAEWNRSAAYQSTIPSGRGDVIPGSWDRVDRLPVATQVAVTLKTGERVVGRFQARRPDAIVMADPAGNELAVPTSDVFRVTAPAGDKLTNGALIGAGIGLGTAVAALAIAGSGEGYLLPSAKWGAPLLLSSVGSIAGILVDRMHQGEALIYTAPVRSTP